MQSNYSKNSKMINIPVKLGEKSYGIYIQNELIKSIPIILKKEVNPKNIIIISQDIIIQNYGKELLENFNKNNLTCEIISIVNSENAKSLNEYNKVIKKLFDFKCDRSSIILALGGGVVGDLAGFVASTFMRGIKYYQIPTTLLSMVDSSIGGKTGINTKEGKNLIGSYHQPKAVLIDPYFLNSLPKEEVYSGLGEIVKYGFIKNIEFLEKVDYWLDDIKNFPFIEAITESCKIKAEIVSKDEMESGLRRILNFGHTIGHAIEAHVGYNKIRHGEAIAYGMLCAGWISEKNNFLNLNEFEKLVKIIKKLPLPKIPQMQKDDLLPYILKDKKNEKNKFNFIVLDKLGNAISTDKISINKILESLIILS